MKYKLELDFWPGSDVLGRVYGHAQNVVSAAKKAGIDKDPDIVLIYAPEDTGNIDISVHWWSGAHDVSASILVDHDGNTKSTEVVLKVKTAPETKTIPY